MKQARAFHRCERGAVFVQVGIAAAVLVAFNVFVLDYGMMWVARRQAQNAADAGALAGAIARGYDDLSASPSPTGLAARISEQVVRANLVWQEAPAPEVSFYCPPGVSGKCVQVDVYRNGQSGSTPLPTLFGPLLGVSTQGVRATATAIAGKGNATNCLKPWAIPDSWQDGRSPNDQFDYYDAAGNPLPPGNRDEYTPPGPGQPGHTTVSADLSERIIWSLDRDVLDPSEPITRRNVNPAGTMVLPLVLPGTLNHTQNMTQCNGNPVALGQTLPIDTGIATSPATEQDAGLQAAWALDNGATLDVSTWRIVNSCAPACAPVSPRLLAIVLFDPRKFQFGRATGNWVGAGCPTNSPCVTVSNIVGLFLHGTYAGYLPHGHILPYPGITATSAPLYDDDASWLVTTHLVR